MRVGKVLAVVLAALIAVPVFSAPEPAHARSLFDALFPRAAERRATRREYRRKKRLEDFRRQQRWERNQRRALRRNRTAKGEQLLRRTKRARRRAAASVVKIAGPQYYTYKPTTEHKVSFSGLRKAIGKLAEKRDAERRREISKDSAVGRKMARDQILRAEKPFSMMASTVLLGSIDVRAEPGIGKALTKYYASSPEFLWIDENGQPNDRALAVIEVMSGAEIVGLRVSDYEISQKLAEEAAFSHAAPLKNALSFEFGLTARAMRYFKDAQHGRIDPNRISGYHDFPANKPNYSKMMATLAKAADPASVLKNAHPRDRAFNNLKDELARLRAADADADLVIIVPGTFIKPKRSHPELPNVIAGIRKKSSPELLEKHADALNTYAGGEVYDAGLVAVVRDFQKENGLGPDGIIGRNTLAKLVDVSPEQKIGKVLMAMERLRWHPSTLGSDHVFINQPAYRASYISNGQTQLSMRAIIGKRSNQTSYFHDQIEYVEYNPYWGVPQSIIVNEMLPKLRRNPAWLDQRNYEVTNSRGRQIASANIDWWSVGSKPPYDVRQRPGGKNALGELKIMFPNKHSIYMHDTPARNLFSKSQRALSHGCVRLQQPHDMAAAVLGTSVSSVHAKVAAGANKTEQLKRKIPVYVSYFTAWPDDAGEVKYYTDVYGRDEALTKATKATDRARGTDDRA